jgi:hypothetical protein
MMSSLQVIGLTTAIFIPAFAIFFRHADRTNDMGTKVYTGIAEGLRMSAEERRILLYQGWVPTYLGLITFPGAVGYAIYEVAQSATESGAKLVALIYAFLFFIAFLGVLLTGAAAFVVYAKRVVSDEEKPTDG